MALHGGREHAGSDGGSAAGSATADGDKAASNKQTKAELEKAQRLLQKERRAPKRDKRGKPIVPPSTKLSTQLFFSWIAETCVQKKRNDDDEFNELFELEDPDPVLLCDMLAAEGKSVRLIRQLIPETYFDDWGPMVAVCDLLLGTHRHVLRKGVRVVELGCGIGLPSLICAVLGACAIATDIPVELEDVSMNATISDFPQSIWRVAGGLGPDGVPVTKEKGGMTEKERLSIGALVQELEIKEEANLMHYRRLTGTGPDEGWVQMRRAYGNKELLVRTDERPPPKPTSGFSTGIGSLLVTPLRWDAQDALNLLRRVDELQASARVLDVRVKTTPSGVVTTTGAVPPPPKQPQKPQAGRPLLPPDTPDLADFVVCSDCVCEPVYGRTWDALADTIEAILAPHGVAIISLKRRSQDGVDKFLKRLAQRLRFERCVARKADAEGNGLIELLEVSWPTNNERFDQTLSAPGNPRGTQFLNVNLDEVF